MLNFDALGSGTTLHVIGRLRPHGQSQGDRERKSARRSCFKVGEDGVERPRAVRRGWHSQRCSFTSNDISLHQLTQTTLSSTSTLTCSATPLRSALPYWTIWQRKRGRGGSRTTLGLLSVRPPASGDLRRYPGTGWEVGSFAYQRIKPSAFVVSLSNHERAAHRQAQGERPTWYRKTLGLERRQPDFHPHPNPLHARERGFSNALSGRDPTWGQPKSL